MAGPTEFSLESVRQYMLAHEGRVTNHDLVKHYRAWLTHPTEKESARQRFKEYVNTLATIRQENGEKYLMLKKRFYPSFADQDSPPPRPTPQNTASPSLLDEVMSSYTPILQQQAQPRRQLPPIPTYQDVSSSSSSSYSSYPSYPQQDHHFHQYDTYQLRGPPQGFSSRNVAPPPPGYRPPPPPPPAPIVSHNDLGLPLPSDYGLPAPRQGLFHPPTSTTYEEAPASRSPYYGNYGPPPPPVVQPPPLPRKTSGASVTDSMSVSRSSSVMSTGIIEDVQHPPPLPTRNITSSTTSLASSSSNSLMSMSRKTSCSEDKENETVVEPPVMMPSIGKGPGRSSTNEKISVKERTKTFNRMASQIEVAKVATVPTSSTTASNLTSSTSAAVKRRNSRAAERRGSSVARDDDSSSISTLDQTGKQWMVRAAQGDYLTLIKMLRDDPRLAKHKDFTSGYTALHWAAKHGNMDLVKLLAGNYSVPVNVKSFGGYTPLHLACQFGHQEVFDLLVKAYGADANMRDNSGKKARQYMQLAAPNSAMGLSMSNDTFRQLKDRRRNRTRQKNAADKNSSSGILRFGSLSVKVKKTTEAFNNYFGNDKKTSWSSSSSEPHSLPSIGGHSSVVDGGGGSDDAKMPPPKFAPIKKRKSKRSVDYSTTASTKSAPATPTERSPIKEETFDHQSDSDSEYGFDSQWSHQ